LVPLDTSMDDAYTHYNNKEATDALLERLHRFHSIDEVIEQTVRTKA
jgi:hypothetical protein